MKKKRLKEILWANWISRDRDGTYNLHKNPRKPKLGPGGQYFRQGYLYEFFDAEFKANTRGLNLVPGECRRIKLVLKY